MDDIKSHKDLVVWQKAVALASSVYETTRGLPTEERFGLIQQLRRAAVSIASNIAEGCARRTTAELVQFLHIARGSLSELETQTMIALDQRYFANGCTLLTQIEEVGRLLNALIRSLSSAKQVAHARACSFHKPPTANR